MAKVCDDATLDRANAQSCNTLQSLVRLWERTAFRRVLPIIDNSRRKAVYTRVITMQDYTFVDDTQLEHEAVPQMPVIPSITFEDGELVVRIEERGLETGQRLTKGEPNGKEFARFGFSRTMKQLEDEANRVYTVRPDGSVHVVTKHTLVHESVPVELVNAKRDKEAFRKLVADVKKFTGLVKPKGFKLTDNNRLTLADLNQWIDGNRKVSGYDYAALPNETKDKIAEVMDKLANGGSKTAPKSAAAIIADEFARGIYDQLLKLEAISQAEYDERKAVAERYAKQVANLQKAKGEN